MNRHLYTAALSSTTSYEGLIMAASLAEIEMRVRVLEAKTTRLDEDTEAYGDTITDTNVRVRRLERAIEAIAAALNVEIPAETDPELEA